MSGVNLEAAYRPMTVPFRGPVGEARPLNLDFVTYILYGRILALRITHWWNRPSGDDEVQLSGSGFNASLPKPRVAGALRRAHCV